MTSKEVLEKLKQDIEECTVNTNGFECVYIVKSCLLRDLKSIEDDLEVLEILLKKEVDIYLITHSMDVEQYNKNCGFSKFSTNLLDKKEFEILQKRALELENE